ncbi:MAG: flagellar motor protein MotB [Gammaproteobacteria bacterium]|nr:flagellar motor protein MotB [Gammaproteobacteria bacterium]
MDDEAVCECEEGIPGWVMTFADLMSLLMCFFVLLLSFSEMDVQKYKQVAGSMKFAFGVQREIKAKEIPKGTSVVAQEFSPGKPVPTPLIQIRQMTTEEYKQNLDFTDSDAKGAAQDMQEAIKRAKKRAEKLKKSLAREIKLGLLEVLTEREKVILRIRERGSFSSGKAALKPSFIPVLNRIGHSLKKSDGQIIVAGHTDNLPISTRQFSSNWVLSASRAASVVHFLTQHAKLNSKRFEIRAHADVVPLATNSIRAGRAKNRRIEIILVEEIMQQKPSKNRVVRR